MHTLLYFYFSFIYVTKQYNVYSTKNTNKCLYVLDTALQLIDDNSVNRIHPRVGISKASSTEGQLIEC